LQAEKILGSLGGFFSRKWKPRLACNITGPLNSGGTILLFHFTSTLKLPLNRCKFHWCCCEQGAMTKAYGAWLSLKAIVDVQEIHSRDKVVTMQRGQHWG